MTTVEQEQRLVDEQLEKLLAQFPAPASADPIAFLGSQYDLGLAWVHFERDFGGLAVTPGFQSYVDERLDTLGAPSPWQNFVGLAQSAAVINAVGTGEQKRRFLRPIFTGEEQWCQLFSEPGAGSDLAGLATRAVQDGDEWIVNGQKVWTSGAKRARWGILLARTNPDVPKHRGLTFFVCDMHADGVDVRPLRQADGGAHFNEVFLADVRLPDWLRVGEVGQGWAVALIGLHSERQGMGDQLYSPVETLLEVWQQREDKTSPTARVYRDQVVKAWMLQQIMEYSNLRLKAAQDGGGSTPLGSIGKIFRTRLDELTGALTVTLLGARGQVGIDYDAVLAGDTQIGTDGGTDRMSPQEFAIYSRSTAIGGGTDQIMRNIIGERVLGLPGDIRVDKTLPWTEVPRR